MWHVTERDLLFAALALQRGFVTRETLLTAMDRWVDEQSKSLEQILHDQGAIDPGSRSILEELIAGCACQAHDAPDAPSGGSASSLAALLRGFSPTGVHTQLSDMLGKSIPIGWTADDPIAAAGRGGAAMSGNRYTVLRPHARGGLGEVLVARDEELNREVAVKEILAAYANDPDLRVRFVLEAEITGGLEHPGIVPVYGLGQHADGRPYYAMRFIRGESLLEAVRRYHGAKGASGPLGEPAILLRRLLSSYVAVCNTVAYAHSRGVIHRDLKPENVMLGPYGETLVVDWGLAKLVSGDSDQAPAARESSGAAALGLLQPASAANAAPTRLGVIAGTFPYMSPEQTAGLVDQLGPASDIYSLGVILYVILTNRTPVQDGCTEEMWQTAINGQFPRPSAVSMAVPRGLEAICIKAMAHDPDSRYATARQLAEDVEAWLADESVSAWHEPWHLRSARWMRRHRTLVGAAGAGLLVAVFGLSIGVGLLTDANQRVRASRDLAEDRKREAQDNFQMARSSVDRYLTRVSQDPRLKAHGLEPLRRDLLETARRFFTQFAESKPDDPVLQGESALALMRLAEIEAEIGSKPKALGLLDEAKQRLTALIQSTDDGDKHRHGLIRCLANAGLLHLECGRRAQAGESLAQALALAEELAGRHAESARLQIDLAGLHQNLARLSIDSKQLDDAEASYRAGLAIRRRLAASDPREPERTAELAETQSNLGLLCHLRGRGDEASALLVEARRALEGLVYQYPNVPVYQSSLVTTCTSLAMVYADTPERAAEAESTYQVALEAGKRLAEEHRYVAQYQRDWARGHNNLATLYCRQGRWREAEKSYQAARDVHQELVRSHGDIPEYQNDLASTLTNLGNLYSLSGVAQGNADAEIAYRRAVEIRQRLATQYPDQPDYQSDLATTYNNLGTLCIETGRADEAEVVLMAALKYRQRLATRYPLTAQYALDKAVVCTNLGQLAVARQRPRVAVDYCTQAVAALKDRADLLKTQSTARQSLRNAYLGLAKSFGQIGEHTKAVTEWERALAVDAGGNRGALLLGRAEALARAGDHVRAAADVQDLRSAAGNDGDGLYRLASVLALASAAAAKDVRIPEAGRKRLADEHAHGALGLLRQAQAVGHFRDAAAIKQLREDAAFQPLRGRDDFRAWIAHL